MANQSIMSGPGNNVPVSVVRQYHAISAITKGQPVALSGQAAITALADSIEGQYAIGTVIEPCDTDAADTATVIGVAKNAIAAGAWGSVYIGGFCPYIVTDGSVAEGDVLVSKEDGTAGTAEGTAGGTGDLNGFGIALDADSGNVLYSAIIWQRV